MPARSQRQSSHRPAQVIHAGGPHWSESQHRLLAASTPRWAVSGGAQPATTAGPPWEAQEPVPAGGQPGSPEPGWSPRTPPVGGNFTYSPGDSGPNTGSLPAITGGLIRRQGSFTGRISRDGSTDFPAEPSRYQLYASLGCPWSQRALIVCRLLGLDRVIGLTLTEPVADERGWRFGDEGDPLTGARFLSDLYRATDPAYTGPCTVPLIWDLRTRRIVNNDVSQITVMLETEFRPFHRPGSPDLYPAARRREIESLATLIFHTVNTGVYKAGLANSQSDYEHLWGYTRDLYTHPGFGETTDLGQIKRHYFQSTEWSLSHNRFGIVPIGPQINWN